MSSYKGMRWYKCDFQVQTPEFSSDWLDTELKLKEPRRPLVAGKPDESDIQEKARTFLRRCHALSLDVVAITDHNFSSKPDLRDWFLTHLVEQNRSVAAEVGREPLHIFPGFEVDIGYHVLCLFAPASKSAKLSAVSETLTTLGLSIESRFKGGRPSPLRNDNRYVSLAALLQKVQVENGGIVIAAHAFSNDGICNEATHIDDYKNEDLLCVEVPESPLVGKSKNILEGNDKQWSRERRQPAAIMSSDAKSLREGEGGKLSPNSLGYRYSWLKMSSPSIEALRQAFLDPGSRIALPTSGATTQRPDLTQTYPRLVSLSVANLAFLADQSIHFSPNLNCVIGGRGTGKSTLLECIRFATNRTQVKKDVERKIARVRRTFTEGTEIRIAWQTAPGVVDEILFAPGATGAQDTWRWDGKNAEQIKAFLQLLPLQIFSQGELTEIASDEGAHGNRLLPLIDASHTVELHQMEGAAALIRADVMKLYAAGDQKRQLSSDLEKLKIELQELDRQWQARQDVQTEAAAHRTAQTAERYLRDIVESMEQELDSLSVALGEANLSDGQAVGIELPRPLAESSDASWFERMQQDYSSWRSRVHSELARVVNESREQVKKLTLQRDGWAETRTRLQQVQTQFYEACKARGLQPQDVSRLQELDRQRQVKAREIDDKQRKLSSSAAEVKSLEKKPEELSRNWLEQYSLRERSVEELNSSTAPTVVVSIQYMGDQVHFASLWSRLAPDGRTKLGKVWDELGEAIFVSHLARQDAVAIWDWLRDWVIKDESSPGLQGYLDYRQDLREHLTGVARATWHEVRNTRVADLIDITLHNHSNGQRIGSMSGGELSEGQRNTAVLTVLLAQGAGPMVIDQPEDEVDSNFLYEHLVPVLRDVKNQRQLIFVTHNANIPVNADAELIYALEAVGGHGQVRAQGGLDVQPVTDAVLDIMEGTDEAFRRRSEKYNF